MSVDGEILNEPSHSYLSRKDYEDKFLNMLPPEIGYTYPPINVVYNRQQKFFECSVSLHLTILENRESLLREIRSKFKKVLCKMGDPYLITIIHRFYISNAEKFILGL